MTVIQVQPLKDFENLSKRLKKFVDEFPETFSVEVGTSFTPRMDIVHDNEFVYVYLDVPGVRKEDIKMTLQEDVLTISGEKKEPKDLDKKTYYKMERAFGSFTRSVSIPVEIDKNSIRAKLENGVLEVTIKKAEAKKPEEVEITIQ
ncbi:MAG: Hsp20/alpha crystallin family protein [Chlorobi bacterium]|nr:Hsp20/alpha crystallin family protein [Chlorobiota bacterium]